ncbi:MAG: redoxin domain-containing protein [Bacteroidaceae bacterium]|nr:redoxin domain-containing protein [Bacteroidaceae bacterium]
MKKFGLMAMAALMMVACQDKNAYTITGTFDAAQENDSVSLQLVEGRKLVDLQKVPVVNGKFEFKGMADSVQLAAVTIGDAFCQLFLEPGQINVDLKANQMSFALGTPNNNAYEAFMSDMKALEDEYAEIAKKAQDPELSDAERNEIKKQMGEFEDKYVQAIKNSITDNAGTYFGLNNLTNSYYYYNPEELAPVLESYLAAFPTNARLQRIKANNDLSLETAVGKQFKDFEMADVDGNMHKLSEYIAVNEVTLVDFWASWCGPCRQEMPAVKAAYEAYKDKGFGIVGVSLDNNKEAWVKAIADLGIEWPQISDLQGWNCAGAKLYGVNSIPATVLVAKDGTILAKNLRGEAIQEKLTEVLK